MQFTVILVPGDEWVSAAVPALPGCVSQGRSRRDALANVRSAMDGWIQTEAEQGHAPLDETPELVSARVAEALEIIDEMRDAGELPPDHGYELELVSVKIPEPSLA